MATVTKPNGRTITVKNLRWLIRHASDVEVIRCTHFTARDQEIEGADARLTAWLSDGTIFTTLFQSRNVLTEWIKRPSLRHAKIETLYAGTLTEG